MPLEPITCNNCGAPLEVPEDANYVTCTHCDSQLAIRRTGGARFTEVLDDLRAQVAKLTRQNELDALDRRWDREKEQYLVTDKHGRTQLPTKGSSVAAALVVAGFGLFWTIMAFSITSRSPFGVAKIFPLFGVLFIGFGVFAAYSSYQKAERYDRAYRKYQRARRELEESRGE